MRNIAMLVLYLDIKILKRKFIRVGKKPFDKFDPQKPIQFIQKVNKCYIINQKLKYIF